MRTITIGTKEYRLIETAEELNIKRYNELEAFLIYKQTGVQANDLTNAMQGFIKGFDDNSKSKMLLSLHEYLTGIKEIEDRNNADQRIFSLICLEPDEDPNTYNAGLAIEKLERLSAEGLTQGYVKEAVENFIIASPLLYAHCLAMNLERRQTQELQS